MAKTKTRGNGEGTIFNNGKYWVGQVTVGRNPETGTLKRKTVYAKTKREASEKIVELQNTINKGIFTDATNATVAEWTQYWLENFKKNQVNDTTYENYEYKLKNHIIMPFGNLKIKNLTTYHLQDYINNIKNKGFTSSYIKSLKNTFNSMFVQAVKLEAISKNPCDNLVMPKIDTKKDLKTLTKEEQEKFVNYCYENNKYLFLFMLGTGVRISEALGLTWEYVDSGEEIIEIKNIVVESKGLPKMQSYPKAESSMRDIPISEKTNNILMKVRDSQDKSKNILNLVFPSNNYKLAYKGQIRAELKKICEKININEITPHILRHTFATRMLEKNCNIKVLSEILGHKNISITLDVYAHVLPSTKKENIKYIDAFL